MKHKILQMLIILFFGAETPKKPFYEYIYHFCYYVGKHALVDLTEIKLFYCLT